MQPCGSPNSSCNLRRWLTCPYHYKSTQPCLCDQAYNVLLQPSLTHTLTWPWGSSKLMMQLTVLRAASLKGSKMSTRGRVRPWSRSSLEGEGPQWFPVAGQGRGGTHVMSRPSLLANASRLLFFKTRERVLQ